MGLVINNPKGSTVMIGEIAVRIKEVRKNGTVVLDIDADRSVSVTRGDLVAKILQTKGFTRTDEAMWSLDGRPFTVRQAWGLIIAEEKIHNAI